MADLDLVRDFVNSVDFEEQRDELSDARGLVRWLAGHRLAGAHARARDADAAGARAVREALRELLRANNGVAVDEAAAAATLDAPPGGPGSPSASTAARSVSPARARRPGRARQRARRRSRGDGRRLLAAPQGLPLRHVPLGVRRQRAQPLAAVVLDERLREPPEGARLPRAACVRACASSRRCCPPRSRSVRRSACSHVRRTSLRSRRSSCRRRRSPARRRSRRSPSSARAAASPPRSSRRCC